MKNRCMFPLILCFGLLSLTSCSPFYVMRAAYEEGKILAKRRDIDRVLLDPETTPQEREKLTIVKEARLFAMTLGLTPKKSFTKYTRIDKDVLTWVVVGSKADSFTLRTWWYPIVGTMPYKGFFSKESAEHEAENLRGDGYETWVRGSEAFSTLGWFNDPVLTPTLKQNEVRIANTVIHEIVHSSIWIKNNVPFNESLANFVGMEGAVLFFENRVVQCAQDAVCSAKQQSFKEEATKAREIDLEVAHVVESLYQELRKLYLSSRPSAEKLTAREEIFTTQIAPLRAKYPKMRILNKINNAEIMQLVIYMTHLDRFRAAYEQCDKNWGCFFDKIRKISKNVEKDGGDPFKLLEDNQ